MSVISQFLQKIVVYLRYYFKANTRYRFHSPYLFHLIESCFDAERNYYDFSTLGENYLHLVNRNELIGVDEFSQKGIKAVCFLEHLQKSTASARTIA